MPRHQDILKLGKELWAQALKDDVAGLSAEIAYRTFLELFPFFIFLAMLPGNPTGPVLDLLSSSLPQGAASPIRQELEQVLGTQQGLIGLPLVGVLWLAA